MHRFDLQSSEKLFQAKLERRFQLNKSGSVILINYNKVQKKITCPTFVKQKIAHTHNVVQ